MSRKPKISKTNTDTNIALSDTQVAKLVSRGKKNGYLTIDDVLEIFPTAEENI